MISEPLPKGKKYWTVASWTSRGMQAWEVTWTNDLVDHQRLREGRVFATKQEADVHLSEQEELAA